VILDISELGEVERWILIKQFERLKDGQVIYGPWPLHGKDNFYESVLEVLDRNNYMAAETIRRERGKEQADGPTAQT
jgi:hypothetical protein